MLSCPSGSFAPGKGDKHGKHFYKGVWFPAFSRVKIKCHSERKGRKLSMTLMKCIIFYNWVKVSTI